MGNQVETQIRGNVPSQFFSENVPRAGAFKTSRPEEGEQKDYRKLMQEKMAEMAEHIKNGTIQPKFQTGSRAYTVEEWDKLLEKVDAAEESIMGQVREAIEEAAKEAQKKAAESEAAKKEADEKKDAEEAGAEE